MKACRFYTTGNQDIIEETFNLANIKPNEIRVNTKLVGICRSDVEMYNGTFSLPKEIQGHEGLGRVVGIGNKIKSVDVGDCVATNADNCFSDYYNVPEGMFIKVPKCSPEYILEPVACAFNIILQAQTIMTAYEKNVKKVLICGTGFLSKIISSVILSNKDIELLVVGDSNVKFFCDIGAKRISKTDTIPMKNADLIIDLSETADVNYLIEHIISDAGVYVIGSKKQKTISQNYEAALWKSVTFVCPSPRGALPFHDSLTLALEFVDDFDNSWIKDSWTNSYLRDNVRQGFDDANNRNAQYGRGYIIYETK